MRSFPSTAVACTVAGIAAVLVASGGAGCSTTRETEVVPGAITQVQVPEDLQGITVEVTANGQQKFCNAYVVAHGQVELPATLGVVSGGPNTTLRITIRGYDDSNSPDFLNCGQTAVNQTSLPLGGPAPRVLRQAILTYVENETLFLPMTLSFSCYDVDCSSGSANQTCKAHACVDANVDSTTLARFEPSLVDGTQDCFDVGGCMSGAQAATLVDAASCLYTVPAVLASAAQSTGYNVRITYTDVTWARDPATGNYTQQPSNPIETEILNLDAAEGYSVPSSTEPLQFALAPGLCDLAKAAAAAPIAAPTSGTATYHTISDVDVAIGCASKPPLLPFCAGQQHLNVSLPDASVTIACGVPVALEAAPSALYMAMDDSGAMTGAFGQEGYATAMNLSLSFPVFSHTYVAFDFLTHNDAECTSATTGYTSPSIDFGLAPTVQPLVAQKLQNWAPPDTAAAPANLDLGAAMRIDAGTYAALTAFAARAAGDGGAGAGLDLGALMLFVNRIPVAGGGVDAGTADAGGDGGAPTDYPQTAGDCTPPGGGTVQATLATQAQAALAKNVNTYFVVLNDTQQDPSQVLAFYNGVASASAGAASVIDATSAQPELVVGQFASTLASLTACLYALPAGVDTTASLTFTVPPNTPVLNPSSDPVAFPIAQSSTCTAATAATGSGWNIDNGRIRLCGTSCTQIEQTISAVAGAALQSFAGADAGGGLPGPDAGVPVVPPVPVEVTMPCAAAGDL